MGKLEAADGGTVFFDDIDSLDIPLQAKLLRIIQERELERLGSHRVIRVDVRFLAASNRNLEDLVASEDFRQDLYYRLNVFPLSLPPLRDRREDIPLLAEHFLRRLAERSRRPPKTVSPRAMERLMAHDWPGNVRELKNLMERMETIVPETKVRRRHLPPLTAGDWRGIRDLPLKEAVGAFERQYISATLTRVNGSRKRAAAALGIHRNTLLTKMGDTKPGS
jgi:DNA-binding NtrC family response regulator